MEQPSNQDLMHFVTDIRDDVSDIKEHVLPEINSRVKTTNGSVADIKAWKERVTGAAWAFGILFTLVVIPLLTWAFVTVSRISDKINVGIKAALEDYNIENK